MVDTDLKKELAEMRSELENHRPGFIFLPRPAWLKPTDGLNALYKEKNILIRRGKVYYAYIVQANTQLYDPTNRQNCPALIVYSEDVSAESDLSVLKKTAETLEKFDHTGMGFIPEELQGLASTVKNYTDRSRYSFSSEADGKKIRVTLQSAMIFRKFLPMNMIRLPFFPIIALPDECMSVMQLPCRYWSDIFRRLWCSGEQ